MITDQQPEFWQQGPINGITIYLQPAAHAILQSRREVMEALPEFPDELLWKKPAGVASIGFHLQHLSGVLDRLFTYARNEALTTNQLLYLEKEGKENRAMSVKELLEVFTLQVDQAIEQLRNTPEEILKEGRGIGRKKIPTTVIGLLFHAAEHVQRHTGQLIVTARIIRSEL